MHDHRLSREPWKLADYIKGFNWLTYYGGKFSTSQGIGVFMDDAIELLPADYWRWYLIANAPESSDASFTWDAFGVAVNKDLNDTLRELREPLPHVHDAQLRVDRAGGRRTR